MFTSNKEAVSFSNNLFYHIEITQVSKFVCKHVTNKCAMDGNNLKIVRFEKAGFGADYETRLPYCTIGNRVNYIDRAFS